MEIRWYFFCFGSFADHFQIKLNAYGSNLNSIFISMSDLEFFLLIDSRLKTPTLWNLHNFLKKQKKTSHSNYDCPIEDVIL
jgi:hypothetical protein